MSDSLIPISDEQAKLGQEALKALQGLGSFMKETFGTLPQDVVALLAGDYLKVRRAENLYRMLEKAKRRLEDDRIDHPDAPPSLAIPIMIGAADESRDELLELWAALLATAANPSANKAFRIKFIGIVKDLDPYDAKVLLQLRLVGKPVIPDGIAKLAQDSSMSEDQLFVSRDNLIGCGLVAINNGYTTTTPLGREFLRAVSL